MDKENVKIIDKDGKNFNGEIINIFNVDNNKYLVYTKEEKQLNGNIIIYISKIIIVNGVYSLENINLEDEWIKVKKYMSNIINN